MKQVLTVGMALLLGALAIRADASPAPWVEGTNYLRLDQVQPTHVGAGKVEVLEVFSYGCPFCSSFQPVMERLRRSLPASAQIVLLPASFSAAEDMPMFQRAFYAAQSLGVAERAHQGIFDAVWKTGELAIADPATHRLKSSQPAIEDAAKCYGRITGVKPEEFLRAARSFGVDTKMRTADQQVRAMRVPSTPCLIVNGKYMVQLDTLRGADEVIDIVNFLVRKESTR